MFRITRKANNLSVKVYNSNSRLAKPNNITLRFVETSPNVKRGKGKVLFGLTAATVASLGGVVAYANYDPQYRKWVTETVPFSKDAFDFFLGPTSLPQVTSPKSPDVVKKPLVVKDTPEVSKKTPPVKESSPKKSLDTPPTKQSPVKEREKEIPATIESSTPSEFQRIKGNEEVAFQQRMSMQETESAAENAALTQILKEMLEKLNEVGNHAVVAHQASISAVKTYIQKIEESIDAPKTAKDATALALSSAQASKNEALKRAAGKTNEAKEMMEKIRTAINRARKSKVTVANPILLQSEEEVNKMMYKLQSIDAQVDIAKSEAKVIGEYRDMVEKAQREFQFELRKLLPEAKFDQGHQLTKDELNEVVAHAHKRVDQLQKQLAYQQASEKHRFQQAIERQKTEHDRNTETKMNIEMNKLRRGMDLQLEQKISELREDFEQELRMQLRRQAAAHSDHLQDVLQVQQAELQSEFNKELEEKLSSARNEFEANLSRSYARLNGIEEGIKARAELNKAARMSQNLWLACQSLRNAIKTGELSAKTWDEQLKPLNVEVKAVKEASHGTQSRIDAILDALPETALSRGIYPESALKERFLHVYVACRRVALVDSGKNSSLWRFFLSYVQSLLLVNTPSPYSAVELANKPVDVKKLTAVDVLSRARWCVERDDLELALRYMNLLHGAPRVVASDWMNEVRLMLEVKQVADVLTALSAARGIQAIM